MMKNPRNEDDLFNIIRSCMGKKEDVLNVLADCESTGSTKLVFLEKNRQIGVSFIVYYYEGKTIILKTRRLKAASENEDWEKITELLQGCDEPRIIKGHGIVIMECLSPQLEPYDAIKELCNYKDVLVDCYYE